MKRIEARAFLRPIGALGCLLGLAIAARWAPTLALINESPSVPRGLYVRALQATPHRGDLVALRQPFPARAYLASLGVPADVRLLKRVAATAGERVCASAGDVEVAGRRLPVQDRDRLGAPLPVWRGCRPLGAGELFLLGDTPNSFDSRYFGPVGRTQAEGVYREVVRW